MHQDIEELAATAPPKPPEDRQYAFLQGSEGFCMVAKEANFRTGVDALTKDMIFHVGDGGATEEDFAIAAAAAAEYYARIDNGD